MTETLTDRVEAIRATKPTDLVALLDVIAEIAARFDFLEEWSRQNLRDGA